MALVIGNGSRHSTVRRGTTARNGLPRSLGVRCAIVLTFGGRDSTGGGRTAAPKGAAFGLGGANPTLWRGVVGQFGGALAKGGGGRFGVQSGIPVHWGGGVCGFGPSFCGHRLGRSKLLQMTSILNYCCFMESCE